MTDNQPVNHADEVDEWVKVAARDRNRDAFGRLISHSYRSPVFYRKIWHWPSELRERL